MIDETTIDEHSETWRTCEDGDLIGVRSLYNDLVPGLVQQIEPPPKEQQQGLIYCQDKEVVAYVKLKYGSRGILAHPFIHPDAEDVARHLVHLVQDLPNRRSRKVYLCVRTYQSWLEPWLEEMGAKPSPRQAVIVKHLAVSMRAEQQYSLPKINGKQAETVVQMENYK
jgi:hypothetical protein